ncbi:MAG: TetR/AcrR family transcriptional regulator [Ktedonobacteraceae bacterium]|nr:TetR/AcrR family transcriptional regulator [Ktedonobacteraceae bacterium]
MATTPKNRDRRVQRTQHLLKQAFVEVLTEKGFPAISIQDVTDRANVNRATFYAHFPDKYALLEALISEKIQQTLSETLPPVSQWDRNTLHLFIRIVLECYDGRDRSLHRPEEIMPQLEPATFERAAHEGVVKFLLAWLNQQGNICPQVPLETIAHMMSWAILGAATQRWQMSTTISSEEMANAVVLVMMEGIKQLTLSGSASD